MDETNLGFTLIELMAAVAVAAIMLVLAVPAFNHLIISSRLTSTANGVVGAINTARVEAIKRNAPVAFCGSAGNSGSAPGSGCSAANQGAVLVLPAGGAVTTARGAISIPAGLNSAITGITFVGTGQGLDGAGQPLSKLVADIGSSRLPSNNHRCVYMTTGTVVSTCVVTGACPNAPPSPCKQ